MLKPMSENAIKAEVFASVKNKKEASEITSKPRTAFFQQGKNGVTISAPSYGAHNSVISNNAREDDVIINLPVVDSDKISIGSSLRTQINHEALSVANVNVIEDITVGSMPNKSMVGGDHQLIKEVSKAVSKPRTALLKEGEDESMVHKNISASLSSSPYKDLIISFATLPKKLIFNGDNLLKKIEEKRKVKQYIYVGRMQVEITQEAPS